jgi:uncharacterized membrane protein YbjE (DUF340 family)
MTNIPDQHKPSGKMITIRLRRRPLYEWLAWLVWLIVLLIILEYAIASFAEHEQQAGITAGALFTFLLTAGLIVEAVQQVESRSPYRQHNMAEPPEHPESE